MIIHANATIQKSMVARIGSNIAVAPIARRDLQARRVLWGHGGQQVPKVFPESEAR